jgi:hypothetical protein
MHECVIDLNARLLGSYNLIACIISIALCIATRNHKATYYAVALTIAYAFSYSLHCDFKTMDPERVWRYVIWSGVDLVFVFSLVFGYLIKKVHVEQLFFAISLEFIAIVSHLVRSIDYRFNNYEYTDWFYSSLIWFTNIGLIAIAFAPVLFDMLQKSIPNLTRRFKGL